MVFRVSVISSRIVGSSMVEGMRYSLPAAIERMVPRRILPDLVFGSLATQFDSRKQAMAVTGCGPMNT